MVIKTEREGFSQPGAEVEGSGADDTDLTNTPPVLDSRESPKFCHYGFGPLV